MDTKIRIENLDYFHSDGQMKAIPISTGGSYPKELNGHKQYIEHPNLKFPLLKLNSKIPNPQVQEQKMESLLSYIHQKGWGVTGDVPDFVTTKHLLKSLAAQDTHLIHICKLNGVVFVLKMDKENLTQHNYAGIFQHFMTKKTENEVMDGGVTRKAIFKATILNGQKEEFRILYSGEVGAVSRTPKGALRHYELDVTYGGIGHDSFWLDHSCRLFWKSFFGGSPSIIVGARTGEMEWKKNKFITYPKNCVYEIQEISRDQIPIKLELPNSRPIWTVSDGKKNLRNFFQLVKNTVKNDGDCFVFSRIPGSFKWNFKRDDVAVGEFREVIRKNLSKI